MTHPHFTLVDAPLGRRVRIRHLHYGRPEVITRLRELGFREDAVVRCIMKGNGNMICEIQNTRIGLDNNLARTILVVASE